MKHLNKRSTLWSIATIILLVGVLMFSACSAGDKTDAKKSDTAKTALVKPAGDLPKMVDFKSPTCSPCRAMEPILAELGEEYAHVFELELVDVSKQENQQRAAQNAIQYIPTQIFYDADGEKIFRHTGFYSKQDILNKWKELGYEMTSKK